MDEDIKAEDLASGEFNSAAAAATAGQHIARPPSATPSVHSVASDTGDGVNTTGAIKSGGGSTTGKRRTWKKPKDKPKRPLSAYNIFFKHERSRIVDGKADIEATPEEVIASIEHILATSRETRRHRKTHGRISFGDLARKIADKWKQISPDKKAAFDHYAELDMRRYRKEVKQWKDKKDNEAAALAASGGIEGGGGPRSTSSLSDSSSMNNSFSSLDSGEAEFSLEHLSASGGAQNAAWQPRRGFHDSMNSSFSSSCGSISEGSEYSYNVEPIAIGSFISTDPSGSFGGQQFNQSASSNAGGFGYASLSSMPSNPEPFGVGSAGPQFAGGGMDGPSNPEPFGVGSAGPQFAGGGMDGSGRGDMNDFMMQNQQQMMQQQFQQQQFQPQQQFQQQRNMDPVPFEQVFPDAAGGGNSSKDLELFLANLDLSNVE